MNGVARPRTSGLTGRATRITRLPAQPVITRPAPLPDEPARMPPTPGRDLSLVAYVLIAGHLALLVAAGIGALPYVPASPWLAVLVLVRLTGVVALLHARRWGLCLYAAGTVVLLLIAGVVIAADPLRIAIEVAALLLLAGVSRRNWPRLR